MCGEFSDGSDIIKGKTRVYEFPGHQCISVYYFHSKKVIHFFYDKNGVGR